MTVVYLHNDFTMQLFFVSEDLTQRGNTDQKLSVFWLKGGLKDEITSVWTQD